MNGYNFTERTRVVLASAREEASALHHEYVGTEHVLLGLLREGGGIAMTVLTNLGADPDGLRSSVLDVVKAGPRSTTARNDLPYTSRAKKTLELAMGEARVLSHNYVGTEHLLLGLLREEKGIAAQVLTEAGITLEVARAETLRILGAPGSAPGQGSGSQSATLLGTDHESSGSLRVVGWTAPQYAERLRTVIAAAHEVAVRHGSTEITPAHATIALLEHGEGIANAALDALRLDRASAVTALAGLAASGPDAPGPDDVVTPGPALAAVFRAIDARRPGRGPAPGTQHLLLSILTTSPEVADVFAGQRVTAQSVREAVRRLSG